MYAGLQANKEWKEAKFFNQNSYESEREFDKLN